MEWPKITCFGDSITRRSLDPDFGCWAGHVAQKTISYYNVDVRGFEGYNTRWGLELMPKLFPKSYLDKVEFFIIFFGHNDSFGPSSPLHVPVDEYETNLRAIVKYLIDNGVDSSGIILMTPSWYFKEVFDIFLEEIKFPPASKLKEDAAKYADAVRRVANDNNISCVDFFKLTADYDPLKSLFCDGIHLSRAGAKLLFENLWPVLENKITKLHGKELPDLYHVVPVEKHPEAQGFIQKYHEKLAK